MDNEAPLCARRDKHWDVLELTGPYGLGRVVLAHLQREPTAAIGLVPLVGGFEAGLPFCRQYSAGSWRDVNKRPNGTAMPRVTSAPAGPSASSVAGLFGKSSGKRRGAPPEHAARTSQRFNLFPWKSKKAAAESPSAFGHVSAGFLR